MSLITLSQVLLVCLLGAMSPGPSMVVVINNAIFRNRYHGILTSLGHGIGISIYALFAVLGLGLIIDTNIIIFNSVKILSIIFLIFLGMKSLTNKEALNFNEKTIEGGLTSFLQGLSISILNPKILIWFIAIYSHFMSENNDYIFNVILITAAGAIDAAWYVCLTLIVTSKLSLDKVKNNNFLISKIIGLLLIFISIGLIIDLFIQF